MSTQSQIGYIKNGKVNEVYCHSDGYMSWNGSAFLAMAQVEPLLIKKLVDKVNKHGDYLGSFGYYLKNYPKWGSESSKNPIEERFDFDFNINNDFKNSIPTIWEKFPYGYSHFPEKIDNMGSEEAISYLGSIHINHNRGKENRSENNGKIFKDLVTYPYSYYYDFDNDEIILNVHSEETTNKNERIILDKNFDINKVIWYFKESELRNTILNSFYRFSTIYSYIDTEQILKNFNKHSANSLNILNSCANINTLQDEYISNSKPKSKTQIEFENNLEEMVMKFEEFIVTNSNAQYKKKQLSDNLNKLLEQI